MISNLRFRLWLLLGGVLAVLLCRGFKGSPGKSAVVPKAPITKAKSAPPPESPNVNPSDGP